MRAAVGQNVTVFVEKMKVKLNNNGHDHYRRN
jgi:hypothetical protein